MRIIAIKDCADGNDSVGTQWKEVKTFCLNDRLSDVVDWANKIGYQSNVILVIEKE